MTGRLNNPTLVALYDERDHLKILINLLEQGEGPRRSEVEAACVQLEEVERRIRAALREATDPPSARWWRQLG
jgi:uncharacterized protein involved in exopolysaccharide biosynthesis